MPATHPARPSARQPVRGSARGASEKRGGRRKGAGRRPNGARAGVSHLRRPTLSPRHPVHVTLRIAPGVRSLRGSALFRTVRGALTKAKQRLGVRLVHFSVQRNHLHLIVEARDRRALARGIQGLSIRVAKGLNRRLDRRGKVFADRYHARALMSPRDVWFAVRYVLLNARKHERGAARIPSGSLDPCSSGAWFDGWSRPIELCFGARRSGEMPVARARSWLLTVGLGRAGPIDVDEGPPRTT